MREILREARNMLELTQEKMAEKVGISLRYYQQIEQGVRTGDVEMWDRLEDITGIHQRVLRENSPVQAERQRKRPIRQQSV